MALPTMYRVGDKWIFLTAERLRRLLMEVLPNWTLLDALLGESLDGETKEQAVAKIEAALSRKHVEGPAKFHENWVRMDLEDPEEIRRNMWALMEAYSNCYNAELRAETPNPIYPGKWMDIYPIVDVFTIYIPVYNSRMKAGLAHILNPPQTAIRIRVNEIRQVMGTLQGFAVLAQQYSLLLKPNFIWVCLEPPTLELRNELYRQTFGRL